MKFFVVLSAFVAVGFAQFCYNDVVGFCDGTDKEWKECHAKYGGVRNSMFNLQGYVNAHISHSFDYLLMSTHFGNHEMSREGFEKLFRKLSDSAWDDAIDLIKYITKRGGTMDFSARLPEEKDLPGSKVSEHYELDALARGLDIQKKLAETGFAIHREAARHPQLSHDPEVSSYLEEHFFHRQAENVRKLAGYANDLKGFLTPDKQAGLSLFLFDEYLQKVV